MPRLRGMFRQRSVSKRFMAPEAKNGETMIPSEVQGEGFRVRLRPSLMVASHKLHSPLLGHELY